MRCGWCGKPTDNCERIGPIEYYYCRNSSPCYDEFKRVWQQHRDDKKFNAEGE